MGFFDGAKKFLGMQQEDDNKNAAVRNPKINYNGPAVDRTAETHARILHGQVSTADGLLDEDEALRAEKRIHRNTVDTQNERFFKASTEKEIQEEVTRLENLITQYNELAKTITSMNTINKLVQKDESKAKLVNEINGHLKLIEEAEDERIKSIKPKLQSVRDYIEKL